MATPEITLGRKPGIYLKYTPAKGRGVFCTRNIKAGEELEVTPSLVLNEKEILKTNHTILQSYVFSVGKISKSLCKKLGIKDIDVSGAMIMGLASFCNHDENPNAEIVWEEKSGTLYHTLVATRHIPKGTEICTTYGDGWFEDKKFRSCGLE